MKLSVTSFVFLAVLMAGCASEPGSNGTQSAPESTTMSASIVVAPTLYMVNVDQLQLRDQPSKNGSAVLKKCTEGTFLFGTGKRSSTKEEAVLRGIPYQDVFVEVQTLDSPSITGWLFAPGLTGIYVGPKENGPDLNKVAAFTTYLKTLPTKSLQSGGKAWKYVESQFGNASGPLADAVYILLNQFLFRMEVEGEYYNQVEAMPWTEEDYRAIQKDQFDLQKYPESRAFHQNGFRLEVGEGNVYPVADWQRLYDFFGPKVSPVMKRYLDQEVVEKREVETEDAGIVIPIEQIAERAVFWERFNLENPTFVLSDQTQISARWTRELLFFGADNTPLFDFETKQIQPEFKAAWQLVQEKYPGTQVAQKCKEISALCAANGWKYTKEIEKWVATNQEQR